MPLNTEEALRRVKLIVPMLVSDVQTAVLLHAIVVCAGPDGLEQKFTVGMEYA